MGITGGCTRGADLAGGGGAAQRQQQQLPPPWQPPPAQRSAHTSAGVATPPPPAGTAPPPAIPPPSAAKPDVNALLNSHLAQLGNIQGYRCARGGAFTLGGERGCAGADAGRGRVGGWGAFAEERRGGPAEQPHGPADPQPPPPLLHDIDHPPFSIAALTHSPCHPPTPRRDVCQKLRARRAETQADNAASQQAAAAVQAALAAAMAAGGAEGWPAFAG